MLRLVCIDHTQSLQLVCWHRTLSLQRRWCCSIAQYFPPLFLTGASNAPCNLIGPLPGVGVLALLDLNWPLLRNFYVCTEHSLLVVLHPMTGRPNAPAQC